MAEFVGNAVVAGDAYDTNGRGGWECRNLLRRDKKKVRGAAMYASNS